MEMLLSPHLQENLSQVMRTSYNIYSSVGFIGFCVIYTNKKVIQSHLLLFESAFIGNNADFKDLKSDTCKIYPLNTKDLDIVKELMSAAIPTLTKYAAHNEKTIYTIE
jgi:hypothetical protein